MLGEAYLENFDDQKIACLAKIDTTKLREIHIRNSNLSSKSIRAISHLGERCKRIRFRNCPLTPDDLKEFDVQKTSLVLEGTTLNVNDLIRLFGTQFLSAKFGSTDTEFTTSASLNTVRINVLADDLEADCFRQMPKLTHVDCFCRDNLSFLKAVEFSQPSISVYAYLEEEDRNVAFWDTIKATPSLTRLSVHAPPRGICPQFTNEHQLKTLDLFQVPDDPSVVGEKLFQEIAKLERLESLTIRNKLIVGEEVSPLARLKKLKRVDIGSLNDDAVNILLDMDLADLFVSPELLSPKAFKRIRTSRR